MTLPVLFAAIVVTSSTTLLSPHRTDHELQNQTVAMLEKERQKWFKEFRSSVSNLRPDRSTIYKLMIAGSMYNYWTKFQPNELVPVLTDAITVLSGSELFLDRMTRNNPLNPFKQLYDRERGCTEIKSALHPLAVRGKWTPMLEPNGQKLGKQSKLRDSISVDQEALKDILDGCKTMSNIAMYSACLGISDTFESCKNTMKNFSCSNPTWIDFEIQFHTLDLMLDVLKFARIYDERLESLCIEAIEWMTKATAPILKQTHRLIYILSTKTPELLSAFRNERESLLLLADSGDLDGKIERDTAEGLMMKLRKETINRLGFEQITEIIDLCTIHLFHHSRITRYARDKVPVAHYFALQLFMKTMKFAKLTDMMHPSRKMVDPKYLNEMIEYIAESCVRCQDEEEMQFVEDAVHVTYPELYGKLMREFGSC